MSFLHLLLVGAGGFFGSIARFVMSRFVDERISSAIPYGTLTVNVAGSFIVGVLAGWAASRGEYTRLLLITGFCGGFTTFSAFALDAFGLITQKSWGPLLAYSATSLLISVAAVAGGAWLGRIIFQG